VRIPKNPDDDLFGREMFRYTRQDAIRDGYLFAITEMAKTHAYLNLPTAITLGLWKMLVGGEPFTAEHQAVKDLCEGVGFDAAGLAIGNDWADGADGGTLLFKFTTRSCKLKAKLVLGPGDDGLPVITIICPAKIDCTEMLARPMDSESIVVDGERIGH
jgi:hypothetical protein